MVVGGAGAGDGLRAQGLSLDLPGLQHDRAEVRAVGAAPPALRQAEKALVLEEHNKAGMKADELGEQQRQIQGRDAPECITVRLSDSLRVMGMSPLPLMLFFFHRFLQLLKPRTMGIR